MLSAIIQARTGSSRLPNKIFAEIEGYPLIWHVVNRAKASEFIRNNIIIATSTNHRDDTLFSWCEKEKLACFRGDEENVLNRFYCAAKYFNLSEIVRITADDPFKDPEIIDDVIKLLRSENLAFAYNNKPPSFPEGLDVEVFTIEALEIANREASSNFEKEHVTPYMYLHPEIIRQKNLCYEENLSNLRWTIDQEEDLIMAREVYRLLFKEKPMFKFKDILALLAKYPYIAEINKNVRKSDMYKNL